MQLLSVASEAFPLIKTGGLGDVVGALPAALAGQGIAARTLLPGYPAVLAALTITASHESPAGRVHAGTAAGLDLLVLDAPALFNRPGNPYTGPDGQDWPDNPARFAALCAAAADIAQGAVPGWQPDIVHCHDWQAGLTPAYLHYRGGPHPPMVMTVHNLAFAGRAPAALRAALNLPPESLAIEGVEFYGDISFLKAGLNFADRITTVSPTYAEEIMTPAFGMGLNGLLRARASIVSGILNGIDTETWNPATDPLIPSNTARAPNKAALQARFGLTPDPAAPLFAVVSRLTWQKGLDLLVDALPTLLEAGAQLCVLGTGEPGLETNFRAAAQAHPSRVAVLIGYDEALAHLIQAGCDALLVPSRFEPCGLTQLCALRYGAIPVVARTGGLADTVIDASPMALAAGAATGITFSRPDADSLRAAIRRTTALYRQPAAWQAMQSAGLRTDVSWTHPARAYAALYRDLLAA